MPVNKDRAESQAARQVFVTRATHLKIKAIADYHNVTIPEVVDRYGGAGIDREYRRCKELLERDLGGEG